MQNTHWIGICVKTVMGRPLVKRFALCYRTVVLSKCLVSDVGVLWPNGWMDQDETCMQLGLDPGHIVLDGDPTPPPPKGHPQFSAYRPICCSQMARWIKMPLGMEVGDFVLDREQAPLPKRGPSPPPNKKFWAHVYCGQTAEWINMVLGMEAGLSPGNIVLDGDPTPLPKRDKVSANYRPISIVAKRLYVSTIRIPLGTEETSAEATLY